ncbi:conjugal transfer protein traD (plasmid) [Vibrio tubiashii ATCC 19109]|uniref:Conjugal transfer protein traD n=2 Tax=Vibrio tubiashii TaxID=29498 RepID=F9T6N7_9VIBR|nr:conjugal transfer protein traD [Vibrio tubiashii ATCC 19109]EGU54442.1 hypothetical protein VITU9109_02672 [Vibrio tubiashii ATCC 19109]EIF01284.1 hypothetical protein VT1337_24400 [Vibrio tubiashii NCIMB 1337 = ATCC 19106]
MFGVPVIAFVVLTLLILVTGVFGFILFGIYSLIVPIFLIACLIGIRFECAEDSRAVEWMKWDFKGWLDRLKCRSNVTSFTSNVDHLKSQEAVLREWLKHNSTTTTDT